VTSSATFRLREFLLLTFVLVAVAPEILAQQRDTLRAHTRDSVVVDTGGPRPERRPPISPRRAFLYSLAVPGYGQSILGRYKTGTILVAFEATSILMRHQMVQDLQEAKRFSIDSIPVSFTDKDGRPVITYQRTVFPTSLVKSRRSHVEDWTAVIIANHLFAGADAYVAALLWDLPSEVAVRAAPGGASVAMTFTF
jgi:hypothetical protein